MGEKLVKFKFCMKVYFVRSRSFSNFWYLLQLKASKNLLKYCDLLLFLHFTEQQQYRKKDKIHQISDVNYYL